MAPRSASIVSQQRLERLPSHYFESLIESSPDIVVAVDRDGLVIFFNDGAEKNVGYSAAEVLGRSVVDLYPSFEEAHRVMVAMRSEDWGGPGKVKNFETTFVDRWGHHFPVAISGSILYDENGLEVASIGFAKDIRDIRRRDRLTTLGEVGVALCHEINSPLEVILNEAELLRRFVRRSCSDDDDAVVEEERVDAVRREVLKIQGIVNRLVDMARKGEDRTREYLNGQEMTDVAPRPADEGRSAPRSLAGLRVLVVDDDLGVCRSLRDLLASEGCDVRIATDGLRGLEAFGRGALDLVISDVVMPDMDGYELFTEIRKRSDTPVILMTGYYYDRDHVIKRSRLEGLENVIFKKPIDPQRLMTMIRTQCGLEDEEESAG